MITVEEFKKYYRRDFPFLPSNIAEDTDEALDYVLDSDIEKAISEMQAMLPVCMFEDNVLDIAQMYLTAHCLVHNMRTGNSGLASAFPFPMQSRSVGSVSESYGIPQTFLQKACYSFYITSGYGLKYLALFYPRSRGNVAVAQGWTLP